MIPKENFIMRYIYKTVCFRCALSTSRKFEEKLQETLDKYSAEGWILHSYHVPVGEFCTIVFYKEAE